MHHPQICLAVLVAGLSGVVYYCAKRRRKRRIVITGACGNLGAKLAKHLANIERYHTVGLEHARFVSEARNYYDEFHVADIAEAKGHWQAHFNGADCVFHFSAVNPYPRATWAESAGSMAHSFNVMLNAERRGVRRVVFASSNHVMGGYKDDWAHGLISPCDPPRCGTLLHDARARSVVGDAVAYAAAKLAAEQLAHALALSRRTTFVVLRIGKLASSSRALICCNRLVPTWRKFAGDTLWCGRSSAVPGTIVFRCCQIKGIDHQYR